MIPLRTVRDIRSLASGAASAGPASEQRAYALLTGLARERQRLLRQQEAWQRRLGRVSRRLAEIDAQTVRLQGQVPVTAGARPAQRRTAPLPEIEFRY